MILVGVTGGESCMRLTSALPLVVSLTLVPNQALLGGKTEKVTVFFAGGVDIDRVWDDPPS